MRSEGEAGSGPSSGGREPVSGPYDPEFWMSDQPMLMPCRLPAVKSRDTLEWRVLSDERAVAPLCRQVRLDAGLSVSGLAKRMGIWERAVRAIEEGRSKRIALDTFVRWVEACGGNVVVERVKR